MLGNADMALRLLGMSAVIVGVASAPVTRAFAQAAAMAGQENATRAAGVHAMPDMSSDGNWPKFGLETIGSIEYAKTKSGDGPGRGPDTKLRLDSTFLLEFSDKLSVDGLFQFKPRQPLSADVPNYEFFINQGPVGAK